MKDPLSNAKPVRLLSVDDQWSLLLEGLVRVSNVVFKPVSYRVEGAESILACLSSMRGQEELAAEAEALLSAGTGGKDLVLEAQPGGWVRRPFDPAELKPEQKEAEERAVEAEEGLRQIRLLEGRVARRIAGIDDRIARLEALERRIARLEAGLQSGAFAAARPRPPAAAGPGVAVPAVGEKVVEGLDVSVPIPEPLPEGSGLGAAPLDEPERAEGASEGEGRRGAGADEALDPKPPEKAVETPLALPSADAVESLLQMLVDEGVKLREAPTSDAPRLDERGSAYYWATLLDDEGEARAAVLADIRAAAVLGGGLLMMPDNVIREHIASGEPSEDMVEAMSEVFNNTRSLFNEVPGNRHVKPTPAERFDPAAAAWVLTPAARRDLLPEAGGRIVLVAR